MELEIGYFGGIIVFLGTLWALFGGFIQEYLYLIKLPKLALPFYPLIGNVGSLPSDPNLLFKKLVKAVMESATKSKICVMWVGMKANVLVIHPDAAEVILKNTKNLKKSSNYNYIKGWIHEGLITSKGKKWQQRRKMITPSFHNDILKDFLYVMNEHASGFVDCVDQYVLNGKVVDIKHRLKLCTLDIICETAMGCKINAQKVEDNEYVKAVNRMGSFLIARVRNPLMQINFIFNLSSTGREQRKTVKILHDFTRGVIEKRLLASKDNSGASPKRKAFLDMLVSAQYEDGSSLSADDLQEEVDTFMFAGHDTTSIALTWAIYLLGRNLDKQKKLHEELDSVFGGNTTCDITSDHINDLPYLSLVLKETLRLYPSVPFYGRNLEQDCEIDGHVIPKGRDVTTFAYCIHRHPDIWEEPNKFIPERFEIENRSKANLSNFAYIPFSAGARNCIGQRFAVQEQKIILAKLFRKYSVESFDEEEDLKVTATLVLDIDQHLNIKFVKRNVDA